MHAFILVDHFAVGAHLQSYLRRAGFESFRFSAREIEAVSDSFRPHPDLILADYRFGNRPCIAKLRRIERRLGERMPPVILMAEMADMREVMEAKRSLQGRVAVIIKPCAERELRDLVQVLVSNAVTRSAIMVQHYAPADAAYRSSL